MMSGFALYHAGTLGSAAGTRRCYRVRQHLRPLDEGLGKSTDNGEDSSSERRFYRSHD
ncbi:hypothetical protein M404DRAFT_1005467 [Pisolithus tinctorius Marx 270]|uniref:Uncharacterized protein n=1 Tax=Pisolithus tinctorius Marx 270 TaxID=870435 RepID=A0A0C3IN37_PISTI|nr:hypothetical protein M404DRAFT_1005467 [Pisolithus tinctorius Marx 270]